MADNEGSPTAESYMIGPTIKQVGTTPLNLDEILPWATVIWGWKKEEEKMDTTKRWRLYKDVLDDQFTGSLISTTLVGIIFSCSEERRAVVWSAIIFVNVFLLGVWAWLGRNAADFVTRSYAINPPIALQIVEKLIGTHGWQYRTEVRSYTRLFHLQEHGITIRMYPIVRNPLGATVTNIYIGPQTAANAPFIEMLQIKLDQDLTPHGLV